jgi:hypothetical protein
LPLVPTSLEGTIEPIVLAELTLDKIPEEVWVNEFTLVLDWVLDRAAERFGSSIPTLPEEGIEDTTKVLAVVKVPMEVELDTPVKAAVAAEPDVIVPALAVEDTLVNPKLKVKANAPAKNEEEIPERPTVTSGDAELGKVLSGVLASGENPSMIYYQQVKIAKAGPPRPVVGATTEPVNAPPLPPPPQP